MKLKEKLIVYYLSAAFVILFFVGLFTLNSIKNLGINTIEQQLTGQSSLAELYITQLHAIQNENSDDLSAETSQFVIGKLGLVFGNIRIYDKDFKLLASSKANTSLGISDTQNREILEAASNGSYAYIVRNSTAYFASPITFKDSIIGILEIIYPMSFLQGLINGVSNILLIGTFIFAILLALISIFIASRLTKPINRLAKAADNYANRIFSPVEIKGSDEIAQLSRSFNEMGIQLQEYILRQKQFVSNVSHELRTPLTAIKGYSELLYEEVGDRPDLKKAVFHLKNESDRLYKLVNEVLTLSRIETGREEFNMNRLNFSDLVNDTVDKMLIRAQNNGVKITSDIESDVYVKGDKEKLVQVVVNLIDNAVKYSPSKSVVRLNLFKESNEVILMISDQGIGIPEKEMPKVFDRFYRAENAQRIPGTGLGLSIAKHIVEAHNGSIRLTAGIEGGTTAILSLPIDS